MKLQHYHTDIDELLEQIDYDAYCQILVLDERLINEGILDFFKGVKDSTLGVLQSIIHDLKHDIQELGQHLKLGADDIITAMKHRDIFGVLKAFGFSIKKLLQSIHILTDLVRKGLFHIFEEIHKSHLIQKLHQGVIKIDDIIEKYPLLKKVGGVAVAALLFYIWMNMSFVGNLKYDFDLSHVMSALRGNYSLADLFVSPAGLTMLALFATGNLISVAWLGSTSANLLLVLVYHTYQKTRDHNVNLGQMRRLIHIGGR